MRAEDIRFLLGRRLLKDELPFILPEEHQDLRYESGIFTTKRGYQCRRCGNERDFAKTPCHRCGTCVYCRTCLMMGRVRLCSMLVSWQGEEERLCYPDALQWKGVLAQSQQEASKALEEAVEKKESHVIWAVCGAGKTEMLFAGIAKALAKGERVCLATPRTDVVLELYPRLRQAFPHVPLIALYGGSPDQHRYAPFVIATTHQLLRYYKAFDLFILDEVDAFPYAVDAMLQYAAIQARTNRAALIYVTATPPPAMKRAIQKGEQKSSIICARYHKRALPVPQFVWCGNWQKQLAKGKLPSCVTKWIKEHLIANRPIFLFVSQIAHIAPVVTLLRTFDERITGVHAEDQERKEKVAAFRKGEIPLLVTTTILERGVTVRDLQVGVLGAEEIIFTESALVQIAGRVGRHTDAPNGDVRFFHYGKTEEMVVATQHIKQMNREALRKGWISS